MNSNPTRTEMAKSHAAKSHPTEEALAGAALALLNGHSVFRFLAETFAALDAAQVDLTLSAEAAGGLYLICEKASEELIDAYGHL